MRRSIAPGMAEGPRAPAGLRGARAMNIAAWSGAGCGCVTLGAAAGTVLVAWAFLTLGPPAAMLRATRQRVPGGRMQGYDALDLRAYLRAVGPDGRDRYRRELRWDLGFVAATGTGLILLLAGTWWRVLGPGHAVLEAVAIAPGVVTALAGLAEDVLLLQI